MKRVKAACICQTLHFLLKEDAGYEDAVGQIRQEVEHYKATLAQKRIRHKIVEETTQSDGSVLLKVIKQYNQCGVGEYLD